MNILKSTVLTKVSTVKMSFSQEINNLKTIGDIESLHRFVCYMHPKNSDIVSDGKSITVYTSNSQFIYNIHQKYITRLNVYSRKKTIYEIK